MNATCLNPQEKETMARQCSGLVRHIASRLATNLPAHVGKEDLLNDGVVGLMDALNRFDPSKGIKFQTYAACRIRGAILDGLRSGDWVSRGARRRSREVGVAEEQLTQTLGKTPSASQVAEAAGLTELELHRRKHETSIGFVCSLDQLKNSSEDADETLGDNLADANVDVEEQAARPRRRQLLAEGLKFLSERERLVLALYYFEELNIREIGVILGVSEARISQIHSRCLRKLRENMSDVRLDLVS